MMKWDELISSLRLGCPKEPGKTNMDRIDFQRDFDRLVFSPAFRRLQGKTQVFPFPETDFIHTRLTHSLETSSVGRSLGTIVGNNLKLDIIEGWELGTLVGVACLAHDIGNPPLGHSGETAISEFFNSSSGDDIIKDLSENQKEDFLNFEGNAMGFHMLTNSNPNITKATGGFGLTYSTLASFVKYPRSTNIKHRNEKLASEKKPGLFSCDLAVFSEIAKEVGIPKKTDDDDKWYRHPFAFLTEAADDICYNIMDIEDGFKHGLISYDETSKLLMDVCNSGDEDLNNLKKIIDERNRIGFLRSKAINSLIYQVANVFKEKEKQILDGQFDRPLIESTDAYSIIKRISDLSIDKIYQHKPVLQIEAAGFKVLPGLLDTFLKALKESHKESNKKILSLIPKEYVFDYKEDQYNAIMSITAYVAGMTDTFAIDTYRNLHGIQLPNY